MCGNQGNRQGEEGHVASQGKAQQQQEGHVIN